MWTLLVVSQVSYYRYTAYYCFCKWVTRHATLDGKRSSLLLWILNDCSRGHLSSPHSIRHFFPFKRYKERKKKSTAVSEGTSGCGRRLNAAPAVFEFLNGWVRLPILSQHFVHSCEGCETHDLTHMHVNCYILTRKASTKYKELSVRPTYCK